MWWIASSKLLQSQHFLPHATLCTAQPSLRKGSVGNADAWQELYITSKSITYNNKNRANLLCLQQNRSNTKGRKAIKARRLGVPSFISSETHISFYILLRTKIRMCFRIGVSLPSMTKHWQLGKKNGKLEVHSCHELIIRRLGGVGLSLSLRVQPHS